MNKNLKKVISTVAAIACCASSLVAFASYNYSDVASTASYYKAVEELSSLGIVDGYEDGSFKPDNNVTRAEAAKMMVATMGSQAANQAEANKGAATGFSDVAADHWASSWIKTGVDLKYINGVGDGKFEPESNVTFIQLVKMLVSMCGYDSWAVNKGGWPAGYLSMGSELKIMSGVTGVGQDTALTRAQAAQLIDNALDAPILKADGFETDMGIQYPKYKQMNGTGKEFASILTQYHDAYRVQGRVTATSKSGNVKDGEVNYGIEYSVNFDDKDYSSRGAGNQEVITAYVGKSGADDYLNTYSEALIQKDSYDEYTILSIMAAGRNTEEKLNLADFDEDSKYNTADQIIKNKYFYMKPNGGKSTKYELSKNAEIVVNGVKVGKISDEKAADLIEKYLVNNTVGNLTLTDVPEVGKTSVDGYYDYINVDYYLTDSVDSVASRSIYLQGEGDIGASSIKIDTEDKNKSYTILNSETGAAMGLDEIAEDDVLNVKAAPTETATFSNSDFYTIYVTRKTAEGKFTSWDKEDDLYTVGGTQYRPVLATTGSTSQLTYSTDYTLYLDMFDRFINPTIQSSTRKIAVVENIWESNDGVTINVSYFDKTGVKTTKALNKNTVGYNEGVTALKNKYINDSEGKRLAYQNRVYEYTLTSTGEFKIGGKLPATDAGVGGKGEYKQSSEKLGSLKLGSSTTILDFGEYEVTSSSVPAGTIDGLEDAKEYTAYGFAKSDSIFDFVIVSGSGEYTIDTNFAVYDGYETYDEDGVEGVKLNVYTGGTGEDSEMKSVVWEDATRSDVDALSIARGSVIIYKTTTTGTIKEKPEVIMNVNSDYATFLKDVLAKPSFNDMYKPGNYLNVWKTGNSKNEKADLVFGPIMDKTSSDITIGEYNSSSVGAKVVDVNKLRSISYDSDCKFILYDYEQSTRERLSNAGKASVRVTKTYNKDAMVGGNDEVIDFSKKLSDDNVMFFALVKTVQNDATEVYVIAAPDNGIND